MSGPKGYSVHVESAEERLRRQTNEAQARCNVLADKLEGLRAVAGAAVAACAAPQQRTLDQLQSWEQRLQKAISKAAALIDAQRAHSRMAAMASTVGLESLQDVSLGELRTAGSSRPLGRAQARADLETKVADLLARASEVDDGAVLDSLADAAKALLGLQGPAQTRAWAALESDVAQAVKRHRVRRRCLADADVEVLRIAHLDGPDADAIRAAAATVADESGLSMLRERVARAVADAECQADAAFVTEQARLALADLGYAVDEPFETLEESGFVARRGDLVNHGLRVQVNPAGKMLTQVIAVAGTTPVDDTAAEAATCADVFAFTAAMAARGVRAELGPHLQPGEVEVEHSLPGALRTRRQTESKRKRVEPQAMGLRS